MIDIGRKMRHSLFKKERPWGVECLFDRCLNVCICNWTYKNGRMKICIRKKWSCVCLFVFCCCGESWFFVVVEKDGCHSRHLIYSYINWFHIGVFRSMWFIEEALENRFWFYCDAICFVWTRARSYMFVCLSVCVCVCSSICYFVQPTIWRLSFSLSLFLYI